MRRLASVLVIAIVPALGAQVPGDSGGTPPVDAAQTQQLREKVRQAWSEHVRSTLELSDEQTAKLQATEQRFEEQRQPLRAHQRETNEALRAELSGATPDEERVRQLMNAQQENQGKLQQINRDEDREMQGFLTPVQRARYHDERRKFQERVAAAAQKQREQRRAAPAHGGPRSPPPPRPGRKRQRP
ncbi:MAG TPA: periplasmic heavy metal sensor [Gemmatimonadales bacterium]|jgi:Spy/CpxP family protein refolding chaperone|nr:periplasmic heavy metal sensor [Gemmatimonadales bacterium]